MQASAVYGEYRGGGGLRWLTCGGVFMEMQWCCWAGVA